MSDRGPPPDGYRWTGRGTEIRLADPATCPAGHPVTTFRRGHAHCSQHGGHTYWTCQDGHDIYRAPGEYVDQLDCLSDR